MRQEFQDMYLYIYEIKNNAANIKDRYVERVILCMCLCMCVCGQLAREFISYCGILMHSWGLTSQTC